jgi:CRISPR-associated protein Cmr4
MSNSDASRLTFHVSRFLLMTVDPVHIGTGGMRLGRVDLSIAREPGTRLPKIPGTSFSGAIRQYAAGRYGKRDCAGKDKHCGQPTCPICYTFGFVKGEGGRQQAHSGVVSIGDARLLFFPVYSMAGPVWVASPSALTDFGINGQTVDRDKARWSGITGQPHLNLGWLMVEKEDNLSLDELPQTVPAQVRERIVLVSDKLFSQVVNSNLEVRTSVSINPETGAAEDKALFTYEAIPRAAFLWLDVVVDDYRGTFPVTSKQYGQDKGDNQGAELGTTWATPADIVAAGLEWAEHLGIGGMGTRGFGRIRNMGEVQR